jgi:hypothetical protein
LRDWYVYRLRERQDEDKGKRKGQSSIPEWTGGLLGWVRSRKALQEGSLRSDLWLHK